jgi:hypothetical protein
MSQLGIRRVNYSRSQEFAASLERSTLSPTPNRTSAPGVLMSTEPDPGISVPRQNRSNVQVSHSSHDGAISVVVTLDGQVRDLQLAASATRRPAAQLASDILGCIHSAQALFDQPPVP